MLIRANRRRSSGNSRGTQRNEATPEKNCGLFANAAAVSLFRVLRCCKHVCANLARSDLIATVPRRLAETSAPLFGVQVCEPPITIRPYLVLVVWHERHDKSALHSWIIGEIEKCVAENARALEAR